MRAKPKIYVVVHHRDSLTTNEEANFALMTPGVDGVFLISHDGDPETDGELFMLAMKLRTLYPKEKKIGINLLATEAKVLVAASAVTGKLDMVWFDNAGVDSLAITPLAQALEELLCDKAVEVFAGVAFKGQKGETYPARAADNARMMGFVPTTSGVMTGSPPTVEKLRRMSADGTQPLAVASGMTPENVADYVPYLTHILVATGVSRDAYHIDPAKLEAFVKAVETASTLA